MRPQLCEVCKESKHKYKCPSCLVRYCSLACFKKHKEISCKKSLAPVEESKSLAPVEESKSLAPVEEFKISCEKSLPPVEESTAVVRPERACQVDEQSCILDNEQLLSIVESNEIRGFLEDGELRELVQMIDSSKNPDIELDIAMKGQAFRQFSDKILSILDPQERTPKI